jgi:sigma-B regulation protein RsbU (phosphoserine phosphatase)
LSEATPSEDFADLYETAPCGYVSLSPQGAIVNMNATLADWLARDRDQLIGRPIHESLGFGGRIAFETHLAPLLRMQGHVHEIALDLLMADGSKVPTIANAAEKRDLTGRHLFTRLTLFKAVDRRTYERSLVEARVKAEAESRAQSDASLLREQFIAVLGHDLRNPLSAVSAGIAMIGGREQLSDAGRAILGEMNASVDRAASLIDDVLDFARGRLGGGLIVERQATNLGPVLEQVVAEIRAIAPDHRIDTHFAMEGPVVCDTGRIAQLASNLLSNAVTHGNPAQPIRVEAATADGNFKLSVANAGEAIPADVRENLFRPFFRGEARASRNGLGLGLFIASEIARAHGGTLEVASNDEETRFVLTMPLEPGDAGPVVSR